MSSGGPDGEGVEVVAQDAPADRGASAVLAFESASARAVAALEVADTAFAADAVSGQPPVGVAGARGLSAGDEDALCLGQRGGCRPGVEAAVQRDVARGQP